jgi:hypothetical protein
VCAFSSGIQYVFDVDVPVLQDLWEGRLQYRIARPPRISCDYTFRSLAPNGGVTIMSPKTVAYETEDDPPRRRDALSAMVVTGSETVTLSEPQHQVYLARRLWLVFLNVDLENLPYFAIMNTGGRVKLFDRISGRMLQPRNAQEKLQEASWAENDDERIQAEAFLNIEDVGLDDLGTFEAWLDNSKFGLTWSKDANQTDDLISADDFDDDTPLQPPTNASIVIAIEVQVT